MTTRKLTIDLNTIRNRPISERNVKLSLDTEKWVRTSAEPEFVDGSIGFTAISSEDGVLTYEILPTNRYLADPRPKYVLSTSRRRADNIVFEMPNRDTTLWSILDEDFVAPPSPDRTIRELPPFPPQGERDNKVAKFDGDDIGWEVDAQGSGGGDVTTQQLQAERDARISADRSLSTRIEALPTDEDIASERRAREAAINSVTTRIDSTDRELEDEVNKLEAADTVLGRRISVESTARVNADRAIRQLPPYPDQGSRDNKIVKFNGNSLGWEEDAGGGVTAEQLAAETKARTDADNLEAQARANADNALRTRIDNIVIPDISNIRQLPTFPAEGSRDNKIAKFDGNTLGWEEDSGGGGASGSGILEFTHINADVRPTERRSWVSTIAVTVDAAKHNGEKLFVIYNSSGEIINPDTASVTGSLRLVYNGTVVQTESNEINFGADKTERKQYILQAIHVPTVNADAKYEIQISVSEQNFQLHNQTLTVLGVRGPKGDKGDTGSGKTVYRTIAGNPIHGEGRAINLSGDVAYSIRETDYAVYLAGVDTDNVTHSLEIPLHTIKISTITTDYSRFVQYGDRGPFQVRLRRNDTSTLYINGSVRYAAFVGIE